MCRAYIYSVSVYEKKPWSDLRGALRLLGGAIPSYQVTVPRASIARSVTWYEGIAIVRQ